MKDEQLSKRFDKIDTAISKITNILKPSFSRPAKDEKPIKQKPFIKRHLVFIISSVLLGSAWLLQQFKLDHIEEQISTRQEHTATLRQMVGNYN